MEGRAERHPDMKNATTGSRSSCLGGRRWREGQRDTQTWRTRPYGRVFRVWVVENDARGRGECLRWVCYHQWTEHLNNFISIKMIHLWFTFKSILKPFVNALFGKKCKYILEMSPHKATTNVILDLWIWQQWKSIIKFINWSHYKEIVIDLFCHTSLDTSNVTFWSKILITCFFSSEFSIPPNV